MIRDGWLEDEKPPESNHTVKIILRAYAVCRRSRRFVETIELPLSLDAIKTYYDYYQPPIDRRTLADCVMMIDDMYLSKSQR